MPRRVLYYTDSTGFGGAERCLLHLLRGLNQDAWQAVVLHHDTHGIRPLLRELRELDVQAVAVPADAREGFDVRGTKALAARIKAMQPDVFNAHLTWPLACRRGLAAAAWSGQPRIVATLHLFPDLTYPRRAKLIQRVLGIFVHRFIAVSQAVASGLMHTFGVPQRKIRVVPNGIPFPEPQAANHGALRAELAGASQRHIVLSVARLDDKQKGQTFLIQAAAHVPEATFVFAGEGPDQDRLHRQARELGIGDRVVFLGHRQDVADLLEACDVFVLPSLAEGLPLSVLEAMAAGKPVVATDVGGTSEVVRHEKTGWLVQPRQPLALAHAIQQVLSDAAQADSIAKAGQALVRQRFSARQMTREVVAVYDEVLRQPGAPSGGGQRRERTQILA